MVSGSEDIAVPGIDITRPHSARMYDYLLGGKDHFAVDRDTAERALQSWPTGRISVRENRQFLGRAVQYLAGEKNVRQFLDIGTGLPSANNTHEVAQAIAPEARVVYTDNDPLVLAHARALLTSSPVGRTAYIEADLREPERIIAHPVVRETLDFGQPVALILVAVLHFIADEDDPAGIVNTLLAALPPGSYLAASHLTAEHDPEVVHGMERVYREGGVTVQSRNASDFGRMCFSGLELMSPGVVPVAEWRPEGIGPYAKPGEVNCSGGVARKRD